MKEGAKIVSRSSANRYEGQAGLDAPNVCGACSCDPPSGSCTLPVTLTAYSKPCNVPGGVTTAFDAPAGWAGACTAQSAIAQGKLCGGVPCVASLTVEALGLSESGCMPITNPVPESGPTKWQLYARACRGNAYLGVCSSKGDVCAPTSDPPPPGFAQCIFHEGDMTGPAPFSKKHVFYDGLTDTRSCSPCACGAAVGSVCSSLISAYKDGACSALVTTISAGSSGPNCTGIVPAGQGLGSKSATPPVYMPGACPPSGGEPMGSAEPEGAATFCCLP